MTRDGAVEQPIPRCASVAGDDGDVASAKCDPCPEASDGAASDNDGDGISDACDPNPSIRIESAPPGARDRLVTRAAVGR